jgi:alpha-1,6-mannosyltransferase
MLKKKVSSYFAAIGLLILFFWIAYKIQRHDTVILLTLYTLLFVLYLSIILKNQQENIKFWIACAVIYRLLLLFSVPNLSEDFYRFIWDGKLLASGHHPFAHPPSYYIENNIFIAGIDDKLYSRLNSKEYFTVYPPVAQFIFWISAKVTSSIYSNLLVLKCFNFISEVGSILVLQKLLQRFKLSKEKVLIYALNPLIIIELSANAHFEAILIFFILLSIYFTTKKRLTLSAISMALAIGVKLVPVIFLPAVKQLSGWRNAFRFYVVTLAACALLFFPLLNEQMVTGFKNSLQYFVAKFEFNASIYYLVRELGFAVFGFNVIYIAGPLLAVTGLALILNVSTKGVPEIFFDAEHLTLLKGSTEMRYILTLVACLLIYYLFTTTLHPWYISTLLALSLFTNFRFVILWTFVIFLTYAGYSEDGFSENVWLVSVEYCTVFGLLAFEVWSNKTSTGSHSDLSH